MRIVWTALNALMGGAVLLSAVVVSPAVGQEPAKMMAADANPSFDVVTIRPTDPGVTDHNLNVSGRRLTIRNMSLKEIIAVVYELQPKQVASGLGWMETEMWDVLGVPDKEGDPTEDQWKVMLKKMMADRFHLRFHMEKREMAAYVLSAPKGAAKMASNTSGKILPSFNTHDKPGAETLDVGNARMQDLCEFMQVRVLERPMVDQTGIAGRYDFDMTFLPDGSQLNGRMPPDATAGTVPAPSLYTAMEEQDGLKLEAKKAPVPVLVIDGVERPSEN